MMNLFSKTVVGLELDALEARAVELRRDGKVLKLISYGSVPLPESAVEDGMIIQAEEVGKALNDLWLHHMIKSRQVILAVSNQSVLVRFAAFPKVPMDKLDNLIRYQAQDFLPTSFNAAVLDYMVTGEIQKDESEFLEVLLVAAQRNMVDGFLGALKFARLTPKDIDVSSLALLQLLSVEDREKTVALVNMNNEMGNILIASNRVPRLARMIPVSLKNMIQQNPSQEVLGMWCEALAVELKSSIAYYQSQQDAQFVEKVILSGDASKLSAFTDDLQQALNIPVSLVNPLEGIQVSNSFQNTGNNGMSDFALCISLARRGLEG